MDFFYQTDNAWKGPVSASALKKLAAEGTITPMTLIMSPDKIPPTAAHKAKGLFAIQSEEQLPATLAPEAKERGGIVDAAKSALAVFGGGKQSLAPVEKTAEELRLEEIRARRISGEIGRFVMHRKGGTKVEAKVPEDLNPFLPIDLPPGKWTVYVHEFGIRFYRKTGILQKVEHECTINYGDIMGIRPFKNREIESSMVYKKAGALLAGFALFGFLGLIITGAASSGVGGPSKFYLELDLGDNPILVEIEESQGNQLFKRMKEQSGRKF